eukprot:7092278-Pyramimonas_sp.AAC.1
MVRHSRYDCGWPHQGEHRQRHAPTCHGRNAILQARPKTTLLIGLARQDYLNRLRSRYLQGNLPARELACK